MLGGGLEKATWCKTAVVFHYVKISKYHMKGWVMRYGFFSSSNYKHSNGSMLGPRVGNGQYIVHPIQGQRSDG